ATTQRSTPRGAAHLLPRSPPLVRLRLISNGIDPVTVAALEAAGWGTLARPCPRVRPYSQASQVRRGAIQDSSASGRSSVATPPDEEGFGLRGSRTPESGGGLRRPKNSSSRLQRPRLGP